LISKLMQSSGLVERALLGAVPRMRRPAFRQGDIANHVCCIRVLVNVELAGRGGDHRKRLDRDIAFSEARQVNVSPATATEQVTPPEQAICVKISNGEGAMQSLGLGGRLVRRCMHYAIELALNDAGQKE